MKPTYPNRYRLKEATVTRLYPTQYETDEAGNQVELTNYNLRYYWAEPDKSENGEFWLMDENGIVNPQQYTAILADYELEIPE